MSLPWGDFMDRNHSRLVVILLAGILFVLLFGREAVISVLGNALWISTAIGAVIGIVLIILAAIRYTRQEARLYREEVRRDREEGRPWLYTFIAWPGAIGNFAVFGFAAFSYFDHECRALKGDCLEQIPFWWLPVLLLLISMPIMWLEKVVLGWQRPRS
jgi:hypothetical protein